MISVAMTRLMHTARGCGPCSRNKINNREHGPCSRP